MTTSDLSNGILFPVSRSHQCPRKCVWVSAMETYSLDSTCQTMNTTRFSKTHLRMN
nr:MAG TPA: hypothetical protein [Caudoviricetes sp.]